MGYGAAAIAAWPRPICNMWPRLWRSMWIASSPGLTIGRRPQRAPLVLQPYNPWRRNPGDSSTVSGFLFLLSVEHATRAPAVKGSPDP